MKIAIAIGVIILFGMLLSFAVTDFINITEKQTIVENSIIELTERAYFEGQRDALNNDIRIIKVNDSCYTWSKSPWDNLDKITYNPLKDCKK